MTKRVRNYSDDSRENWGSGVGLGSHICVASFWCVFVIQIVVVRISLHSLLADRSIFNRYGDPVAAVITSVVSSNDLVNIWF